MSHLAAATSSEPRPSRGSWSEDEIRKLIQMWQKLPIEQIVIELSRNENAISIKASRLGLPPRTHTKSAKAVRSSNPKARVRPCLSCQTPFFSEGAHHRICDKCKNTDTWRSGS